MKNKFGLTGWLLFIAVVAMGAKISDTVLKLGVTGSDSQINMSGGDGVFEYDQASSKLRFSNNAGGDFKEVGSGGGEAGKVNLLEDENADFESGSPPSNWTNSGSSTFVSQTSSELLGAQSGDWDPSATSENLDSVLRAVPLGLEGRECQARILYKWEAGSDDEIKLQALDSGAGLLGEDNLKQTSGVAKEASVNFTCPTSDSIRIRMTSTADAAVVTLDDAHIGSPIIADSVSTPLAQGATVVACAVDFPAGVPTFDTDNTAECGAWIDSLTDTSDGDFLINFTSGAVWEAGAVPVCNGSPRSSTSGLRHVKTNPTTTTVRVQIFTDLAGVVFSNQPVGIACYGKRI